MSIFVVSLVSASQLEWVQSSEDLSPSGLSSGSNSKGLRQQTAFRDVILEEALKEVFENLLAKIKEDKPGQLGPVLRDPLLLPHGLSLAKRSDLADLKLTASHMSVSGLRDLKLTYIRIVRHFGLKDIKASLRVETPALRVDGHYELTGSAVGGLIPTTGSGRFSIDLRDFKVFAISAMRIRTSDKTMSIRDLDVQIDYDRDSVQFSFENLLGGGLVGKTANGLINSVGEAIVESQRKEIIEAAKRAFREQVEKVF